MWGAMGKPYLDSLMAAGGEGFFLLYAQCLRKAVKVEGIEEGCVGDRVVSVSRNQGKQVLKVRRNDAGGSFDLGSLCLFFFGKILIILGSHHAFGFSAITPCPYRVKRHLSLSISNNSSALTAFGLFVYCQFHYLLRDHSCIVCSIVLPLLHSSSICLLFGAVHRDIHQ